MLGHVCCGRLLLLLPSLHYSQSSTAVCAAEELAGCRKHSRPVVRRPHGFVLQRLPAGPVDLLFL